jgi:hypothetical protein
VIRPTAHTGVHCRDVLGRRTTTGRKTSYPHDVGSSAEQRNSYKNALAALILAGLLKGNLLGVYLGNDLLVKRG